MINELLAGQPAGYSFIISEKQLEGATDYGETDLEAKELILSSKKSLTDIVNTLIHEYLHVKFPRRPEESIYKLTHVLARELTNSDREILFRVLANRAAWDD